MIVTWLNVDSIMPPFLY